MNDFDPDNFTIVHKVAFGGDLASVMICHTCGFDTPKGVLFLRPPFECQRDELMEGVSRGHWEREHKEGIG